MRIISKSVLFVFILCFMSVKVSAQGIIQIESDVNGTGSLIVDTINTQYDVQVERYVNSARWHIISSPVVNQAKGVFVTSNGLRFNNGAGDYDLAPYNELLNNWSPYTLATDPELLSPAQGYSMRLSAIGTLVFEGIVNEGEVKVPVTRNNFGWNAIGNPFTSSIKTDDEGGFFDVNESRLDPSFVGLYVWNNRIGDYTIITKDAVPAPDTIYIGRLPVAQGFVIKAGGNDTIHFKRSMQIHTGESDLTSFKSASIPWPRVVVQVEAGGMINKSTILFGANMSTGLDPGYDVGKFKGNSNLALYTELVDKSSKVDFAIQAIPDDGKAYRIPLGVDFPMGGMIELSVESDHFRDDMELYLEDVDENRVVRMDSPGTVYKTSVSWGQRGFGRFYLVTDQSLLTSEASVSQGDLMYFLFDQELIIQGLSGPNTIRLVSVDGRLLYQKVHYAGDHQIDLSSLNPGVYIIQLQYKGGSKTEKFFYQGQ